MAQPETADSTAGQGARKWGLEPRAGGEQKPGLGGRGGTVGAWGHIFGADWPPFKAPKAGSFSHWLFTKVPSAGFVKTIWTDYSMSETLN